MSQCLPPMRWDISDCPSQVIPAESRAKIVVSRSYPTMFGNDWYCTYSISSPDNTKKILVEFQDFYMTNAQFAEDAPLDSEPICSIQNFTISDDKTSREVGPYCGEDFPPSFLSDSSRIKITVAGGTVPDGMWYRGYMYTYKAVSNTHRLPPKRAEVEKDYNIFESDAYSWDGGGYEDNSYDDYYRQVPNVQNGQRVGSSPSRRPPMARAPSSGSAGGSPFQRNPVSRRPYRDPDVEYGTPPPQWDNPFDTNEYDYDYEYNDVDAPKTPAPKTRGRGRGKKMTTGFSDSRLMVNSKIPARESLANSANRPHWIEPNATGSGIVIKEMWSSSTVKRPPFIIGHSNRPYVDPKFIKDFQPTPEPEDFVGIVINFFTDFPKVVLGIGVGIALILLVIIGCCVNCCLRCQDKSIEKEAKEAAKEIRANRAKTAQLKRAIEPMPESVTSMSIFDPNRSEMNDITFDTDPPSYQPDTREVKILPKKQQEKPSGTLKRVKSEEKPKFSEKFFEQAEMPVPTIVNVDKNGTLTKRPAPPLPAVAQEDTSEATHDTISTVREVEIGESYLNINAVSAVSNAMTDSMTLNTESVTTITDMARKSLKLNNISVSTIVTEKSLKIISELQDLERVREAQNGENDKNVESRIEELQNELLKFMS